MLSHTIKNIVASLAAVLYRSTSNNTIKQVAIRINPVMSQAFKVSLLAKLEG